MKAIFNMESYIPRIISRPVVYVSLLAALTLAGCNKDGTPILPKSLDAVLNPLRVDENGVPLTLNRGNVIDEINDNEFASRLIDLDGNDKEDLIVIYRICSGKVNDNYSLIYSIAEGKITHIERSLIERFYQTGAEILETDNSCSAVEAKRNAEWHRNNDVRNEKDSVN